MPGVYAKDKFDEYGDMLENDMINPFEGDTEAIAVGYERFNQRCSYCHGMRGIGAKGPPLTTLPVTYTVIISGLRFDLLIITNLYSMNLDKASSRKQELVCYQKHK